MTNARPQRFRRRPAGLHSRLSALGSRPTGFTLIELLLVLVILAILAGVVVKNFSGTTEKAKQTAAKTDIDTYRGVLANFEIDNGRYPTTEEGLNALVQKPADLDTWKKPYIEGGTIKKDPWGKDYIYRRLDGSGGKEYDLISGGPDGHEGGGDDVTN